MNEGLFGSSYLSIGGVDVLSVSFLVFFLISAFVVFPILFFRHWYFYRRRLKKTVITAEYESPRGFTPVEVSYLFDGKFKDQLLAATVINMIQRGVIHMKKVNGKKKLFTGPKMDKSLKSFERLILAQVESEDGISTDKVISKKLHMDYLNKNNVKNRSAVTFNKLVHKELENRGYVKKSYVNSFWLTTLKMTIAVEIIFIFLPLSANWLYEFINGGVGYLSDFIPFAFSVLFIMVAAFIPIFVLGVFLTVIRGRIVGRLWILTPKLKRVWPQFIGYRNYIKLLERDSLMFENEELKKLSSTDNLSYAVALGFMDDWKKLF